MDRFKFRVWDKEHKKMYDWGGQCIFKVLHEYDQYPCEAYGADIKTYPNFYAGFPEWKDCIYMQCVELKDKNGKLIYEGDIVKSTLNGDVGIGIIEWFDEQGYWNIAKVETRLGDVLGGQYLEVIGNIYENKNLINNK